MRRRLAFLLAAFAGGIALRQAWGGQLSAGAAVCAAVACVGAVAAAGIFCFWLAEGMERRFIGGTRNSVTATESAQLKKQTINGGVDVTRYTAAMPRRLSPEAVRANESRDRRSGALLLAAALAGIAVMSGAASVSDPLEADCGTGETVEREGTVICAVDKGDGAWQLELKKGRQKTLIRVYEEDGQFGERGCSELAGKIILVSGTAELPPPSQNPGTFDYRLYLMGKGIRVIIKANASEITVLREPPSLTHLLAVFRYDFSQALKPFMSEENRGLLAGMMFGDRSMMSDDVYEQFQKNGTAHLLAVSGLHVGVVYACIDRLFRRRRSLLSTAASAACLYLYAALACFSPSVCRALVMILLHRLSLHLHVKYDLLSAASFAALCMLLFNPWQLFHTGFQLSYLAVVGMSFSLPPVDHFLGIRQRRGWRKVAEEAGRIFLPMAAVQAGTAPAVAYLFHTFSLSALIVNVPAVFLSGLILPVGLFAALFSMVGGPVFWASALCCDFLTSTLITLNGMFFRPGVTSFLVVSPPLLVLCLYYGGGFFLASESFWLKRKTGDSRPLFALAGVILSLSLLIPLASGSFSPRPDMVFVAVGQGDCLHIHTPGGKNVLIDTGGNETYDVGRKILEPYLLSNGVGKVDLALITHLHQDHYGGLCTLAEDLPVSQMGLPGCYRFQEDQVLAETGLSPDQLLYLESGLRIELEDGVWLEILAPPGIVAGDRGQGTPSEAENMERIPDPEDENSASLVIRVHYLGATVLMTADLGFEGEETLLKSGQVLQSDILKVGHHGSRYSTGEDFLQAVNPKAAVIQVGKNNYGHPHPDTIEKLKKYGIMVFRTDRDGAVLVNIGADANADAGNDPDEDAKVHADKNVNTGAGADKDEKTGGRGIRIRTWIRDRF